MKAKTAFAMAVAAAVVVIAICVHSTVSLTKRGSKKVWMTVTAYDAGCRKCCGKWARTKKSRSMRGTTGVAADHGLLPKGTMLKIPGVSRTLRVDDTGGAMREAAAQGDYLVDLRLPTHEAALQWGTRELMVEVTPAD